MHETQTLNYMSSILTAKCEDNQIKDTHSFVSEFIIKQNMDFIDAIENLEIKCILAPSCSSVEFISILNQKYSGVNITGVEKDSTIYSQLMELPLDHNGNQIHLINNDFINLNMIKKYDLIIGCPPHFDMKSLDVDTKYYKYLDNNSNMFILFIIKSLEMLNINGVLSFILPSSFLNCDCYNKMRKIINQNYKIINIVDCAYGNSSETGNIILFIIQNIKQTAGNHEFIVEKNGFTLFSARENAII